MGLQIIFITASPTDKPGFRKDRNYNDFTDILENEETK
jgi:hypothetical protein